MVAQRRASCMMEYELLCKPADVSRRPFSLQLTQHHKVNNRLSCFLLLSSFTHSFMYSLLPPSCFFLCGSDNLGKEELLHTGWTKMTLKHNCWIEKQNMNRNAKVYCMRYRVHLAIHASAKYHANPKSHVDNTTLCTEALVKMTS